MSRRATKLALALGLGSLTATGLAVFGELCESPLLMGLSEPIHHLAGCLNPYQSVFLLASIGLLVPSYSVTRTERRIQGRGAEVQRLLPFWVPAAVAVATYVWVVL